MIFTFQSSGQSYSLSLEAVGRGRYRAVIGERSIEVTAQALPDGGWLLTLGGQRVIAYSAALGDSRFVSVDGHDYTLTVADARGRRRMAAGGGDLTAQMPGKVVSVLVSPGAPVQKGQTLVILEAMKMEIRVAAPNDGRVKRLLVYQGDVVEGGQLLLEIEHGSS